MKRFKNNWSTDNVEVVVEFKIEEDDIFFLLSKKGKDEGNKKFHVILFCKEKSILISKDINKTAAYNILQEIEIRKQFGSVNVKYITPYLN